MAFRLPVNRRHGKTDCRVHHFIAPDKSAGNTPAS